MPSGLSQVALEVKGSVSGRASSVWVPEPSSATTGSSSSDRATIALVGTTWLSCGNLITARLTDPDAAPRSKLAAVQ